MVVAIDKATALKMHDKVRKHWAAERERVEREIAAMTRYPEETTQGGSNHLLPKSQSLVTVAYNPEKLQELNRRLDVLKTTDRALIVSPGQNEVEQH